MIDEQPVVLDHKGMVELSVVEVKPFDIWAFVRLAYSMLLSSGVAWILYQNIMTGQARPWLLATGAGFLLCMTMAWIILSRDCVIRKTQYTETKEGHESVDWRLATKISGQAFLIATLLMTFSPAQFDTSILTLLAGVMQAVRLASMLYLVCKQDLHMKARKVLIGHPGIFWFRNRLCHQSVSRTGNGTCPSDARPKFNLSSRVCGHICDYYMCHINAFARQDPSVGFMFDHDGTSSTLRGFRTASTRPHTKVASNREAISRWEAPTRSNARPPVKDSSRGGGGIPPALPTRAPSWI